MDVLRKNFQQPPLTYRGAPFWSWNDRLQINELVRQVNDMKAHGMGGFFMHAREGLETAYMGPEWLECVRETVKSARETGMSAWLYDEDRWPSGFAGGLVPARGGDAFRSKGLTVEECPEMPADADQALALFAAHIEGKHLLSARKLTLVPGLGAGEICLVFRREISGPSEWFNDDAYADNLNPDSVAAFIDITYEAYRREVGADFGKAVPGIFTDEPNIYDQQLPSGRRCLPWTDGLPAFFKEQRGYDLLDILPWLFYDGEISETSRHDYWYTISQRYTQAYSKQLGEWCDKNGLAFTGHFLCENEMGLMIQRGGSVMPHYRYQHVPGIDMLTEQNHEFLTIKQCSSVANQMGRERVLSETFGCSGWEFTFEGQKWNGDWQYVLGVNLRCQHLALYTLRGCRKRDYPPAFNYNSTWWKYNGVVEDYFGRVGSVLTQGHAVRDVLVIHPVSTGWSMLGEGLESMNATNAFGEELNRFAQVLLAAHYDFDFGDEQIMTQDARVEGNQIKVGWAPYRVIVIPPGTRTLLPETVRLLEDFEAHGGKILGTSPMPNKLAARPDGGRLAALWKRPGVTVLLTEGQLTSALEGLLPRRVSLVTQHGQQAARLLYMQRDIDGKQAYFVVNNDRTTAYTLEVELEGSGCIEEWDPLTGLTCPIAAKMRNGRQYFKATFGPAGSRLYIIDPDQSPAADAMVDPFPQEPGNTKTAKFIGPACEFNRTDPNVLTLDTCSFRLEGGEWSDPMEVWRAQNEVRNALGMRPNYYNGLPQRYRWALKGHPNDGAKLDLLFTFLVRDIPVQPVYFLVEGASQFRILLNGQPVSNQTGDWYLDRSFNKVALPAVKKGINELVLECSYTNYMELEDCFLLGDFAVSLEREILAEPACLHFGEWVSQGYPYYAGSMIYHASFHYTPGKKVRVSLGEYRAVDIAVKVNEKLAGHIPWISSNGLEITSFLIPGDNLVDIEVVGSPRNMLGPLHRAPEHEPWTDWRSFRRTDETYTPEYVFWPWGLYGQVRVTEE